MKTITIQETIIASWSYLEKFKAASRIKDEEEQLFFSSLLALKFSLVFPCPR